MATNRSRKLQLIILYIPQEECPLGAKQQCFRNYVQWKIFACSLDSTKGHQYQLHPPYHESLELLTMPTWVFMLFLISLQTFSMKGQQQKMLETQKQCGSATFNETLQCLSASTHHQFGPRARG